LAAAAASVFFALPVVWMALTALRPQAELWVIPPWLPSRFDFESFSQVFAAPGFMRSVGNSVGIAFIGVLLCLGLALPAAYGLARFKLASAPRLLLLFLGLSLLPPICLAGGLYSQFASMNLINTWWALIFPVSALFLPFALWLLSAAFSGVPRELEEAAWVDGCGRRGGFVRVFLPAASGAIASAAMLALAFFWNEFLLGFSLTIDEKARPVTVAVALLQGSYHQPWGQLCAAACLAALPLGLLAVLLQKRLVEGLTAGAGKEG
jgi:ABC-type glycerol-3-phosphate transport system permease component